MNESEITRYKPGTQHRSVCSAGTLRTAWALQERRQGTGHNLRRNAGRCAPQPQRGSTLQADEPLPQTAADYPFLEMALALYARSQAERATEELRHGTGGGRKKEKKDRKEKKQRKKRNKLGRTRVR